MWCFCEVYAGTEEGALVSIVWPEEFLMVLTVKNVWMTCRYDD